MTTSDENTPTTPEPEVAEEVVPEPVVADAPVFPAQPVAAPAPYAAPPAPPQAYGAPNPTPNTWMNIVALVTALLGMVIVPIIFGHLGVKAANEGKADLKGLGLAGLIIGYIELAFLVLFFGIIIIAAIASSTS
ncbi:DUF4190 domain-containing protein [Demequina sp.]|uniref:DUF4190 domain-containing protein n=1 Tax=Demequina sp. TaxID=2050685 RepID=UPI003D0D1DA7